MVVVEELESTVHLLLQKMTDLELYLVVDQSMVIDIVLVIEDWANTKILWNVKQ